MVLRSGWRIDFTVAWVLLLPCPYDSDAGSKAWGEGKIDGRIAVSAYPASCVVDMWGDTVPLSTRIGARVRCLRFGRVVYRTGRG